MPFNIRVRTLQGDTYTLNIPEEKSILDLKNVLKNEHHVQSEINEMRLIYSGRPLRDNEIIRDVRPSLDGQVVHLVKNRVAPAASSTPNSGAQQANSSNRPGPTPANPNQPMPRPMMPGPRLFNVANLPPGSVPIVTRPVHRIQAFLGHVKVTLRNRI